MRLSLKQLTFSLTLLAIGGGAGWLVSRYLPVENRSFQQQLTTVPVALPPPSPRRAFPTGENSAKTGGGNNVNFIAAAVEQVGPAVVRINATRKVANQIPEAFNNPCCVDFSVRSDRFPKNELSAALVLGSF